MKERIASDAISGLANLFSSPKQDETENNNKIIVLKKFDSSSKSNRIISKEESLANIEKCQKAYSEVGKTMADELKAAIASKDTKALKEYHEKSSKVLPELSPLEKAREDERERSRAELDRKMAEAGSKIARAEMEDYIKDIKARIAAGQDHYGNIKNELYNAERKLNGK